MRAAASVRGVLKRSPKRTATVPQKDCNGTKGCSKVLKGTQGCSRVGTWSPKGLQGYSRVLKGTQGYSSGPQRGCNGTHGCSSGPPKSRHGTQGCSQWHTAQGHAYALLQVRELGTDAKHADGTDERVRLLQLRNPWGSFEWTGRWSGALAVDGTFRIDRVVLESYI